MKYITGMFALNIPCSLDTTGDWHTYSYDWNVPECADSENSIFGAYGIEGPVSTLPAEGSHYVANHIRAALDLIETGRFSLASGMRDDYIANDRYTPEIFSAVSRLRDRENWNEIDVFMSREYKMAWIRFKEEQGGQNLRTAKSHNERSVGSLFVSK